MPLAKANAAQSSGWRFTRLERRGEVVFEFTKQNRYEAFSSAMKLSINPTADKGHSQNHSADQMEHTLQVIGLRKQVKQVSLLHAVSCGKQAAKIAGQSRGITRNISDARRQ